MKRAIEVFFPGEGLAVDPDAVYADDHPLVLGYPSKFKDVPVIEAPPRRGRPPVVEQATAAPGEQRTVKK